MGLPGSTPTEERQRLVDAFQKGHLKGLVGTIKGCGVGLTLLTDVGVEDCDSMLFIDLEWNPSLNAQAEDRYVVSTRAEKCVKDVPISP